MLIRASDVSNADGTLTYAVSVSIEYTIYSDLPNFFIRTTLDSTLTTWRLDSVTLGKSLAFKYFQKFQLRGARNTIIKEADLTGTTAVDYIYYLSYANVRLLNASNNLAVSMYSTSLFPTLVAVKDRAGGITWVHWENIGTRTWDGSFLSYGSYIRDISFSIGVYLHTPTTYPQLVSPWVMPNAAPYGIMQSMDELPLDSFNKIQPDPTAPLTYQFWRWHDEVPKARINLMLSLDMLKNGYTPMPGGVDKSWEVHGGMRLTTASISWKNWLKSIEGTWVGFGLHAYHHDYPWLWEFRTVTNVTWIDKTFEQIFLDAMAVGVKNHTWFKAPGYRIQPQGLDILTKYGFQAHNVAYLDGVVAPAYGFYVDSSGRKLISFVNTIVVDDKLKTGRTPEYVYNNLLRGNLTNFGFLSLSGHFFNTTIYPKWKDTFDLVNSNFDVDYFLVEEIIDYWYTVLMPLKYTYNSTMIETNNNDARLTLKLTNSTIKIPNGVIHESGGFKLYAPNISIPQGFNFTRITGYATYTSISYSGNKLSFTVSAPSGTSSTTKVYVGDKGEPSSVFGADFWSYDNSTKILTILSTHSSLIQIIIWWESMGVDLNALMFSEFHRWDALSTRYLSTNATVSDMWDYTRALKTGTYDKSSLSSPTTYFIAMASFYEATGNPYYLNKIRAMVDTYITDPWYRAGTDQGTIFYVPKYWIDGSEKDSSAMATMMAGVLAINLHQWTGETKYKDLADRIAMQSLNFLAVNNSTDMAWVPGYYITPRDEATAKIGVSRQGTIADFYSLYSQYNTSFASYVPKIINWMWRSQISNGGMGYNIGDTSPHTSYTAYSLCHALRAYQNVPTQFDTTLKTKINNTLTWIANQAGTSWYATNWIYTAAFVLAVKSNFLTTPSPEYLDKTKTYLYATLNMMHYSQKGATYTLIDYPFGYRWQELFTGAMFSVYSLPSNLATFTSPKIISENYWTGRYYWQGWALGLQRNFMYVADVYGNTGWYQYPYYLVGSKKSGTATRSITHIDGIFKAWANYTDTKVLTYFYPEGIIFTNSSGTSQIILYSEALAESRLRVENGTEYNLETMTNGTKILSNNFMVWRNTTILDTRRTAFVKCPKTTTWSFTRGNTHYQFTTDLTNYNVTMLYHLNWHFTKNASNTFSLLKTMATQHESLTPLTFSQIINNYKTLLETQEPTPSWLITYQAAAASTPQLIAHNLPQTISITNWNYQNNKLTLTISASAGVKSTTKIFTGNNGEPTSVSASNGALSWSYEPSTMTLTLNVTHVGPAEIIVDWPIPGDVNRDGKVDHSDLFEMSQAYGSIPSRPQWNPNCDFNNDELINASDLFVLGKNYGKTKS
jgi:hypothetical protein